MITPDERALLREFATDQSEVAFAALLNWHLSLVHSAARTATRFPELSNSGSLSSKAGGFRCSSHQTRRPRPAPRQ
jgi:hypothetical protein